MTATEHVAKLDARVTNEKVTTAVDAFSEAALNELPDPLEFVKAQQES